MHLSISQSVKVILLFIYFSFMYTIVVATSKTRSTNIFIISVNMESKYASSWVISDLKPEKETPQNCHKCACRMNIWAPRGCQTIATSIASHTCMKMNGKSLKIPPIKREQIPCISVYMAFFIAATIRSNNFSIHLVQRVWLRAIPQIHELFSRSDIFYEFILVLQITLINSIQFKWCGVAS